MDYEEEEEDLFHDKSQEVNNSFQSSYWETICWLVSWVTGLLCVVFLLRATSVVLRELNFEILEQMISAKKQTCSRSRCFSLVWLSVFKFKDRLLNALILFDKCVIECFQNVLFMAFFIVTFFLFNNCFLQHNQNLLMKLHCLT